MKCGGDCGDSLSGVNKGTVKCGGDCGDWLSAVELTKEL